ncbi:MAG: cell division protein ZapE [Pseudazoarcus pumilus]|nr:cell division protein ZapE [Pseudazoarcus pumilus]
MPDPAAGTITAAYHAALAERGFTADPSQQTAITRLQRLADELAAPAAGFLSRLFSKPEPPRSVYLWGGVGRGKSFVMDRFFEALPEPRKRRVHFHAFMQEVQNDLRRLNHAPDPLAKVVERIATEARLFCFDEFHVSDIADAMILGRLLELLLDAGVVFVMTSNYPPDGLYPNGLQRQRFIPTIEVMKRRFDVLEVDSGTDYRLRALEDMQTWVVPADAAAEARLAADFQRLAQQPPQPGEIEVLERLFPLRGRAAGVIWFDFATLCDGPRSQNDYLEIAREHHTLLLSNVPRMTPAEASAARRFTWLIDVLYDCRVNLVVSAEVDAHEVYVEGQNAHEFARTVSRLIEMRGREYLAEAHRA